MSPVRAQPARAKESSASPRNESRPLDLGVRTCRCASQEFDDPERGVGGGKIKSTNIEEAIFYEKNDKVDILKLTGSGVHLYRMRGK